MTILVFYSYHFVIGELANDNTDFTAPSTNVQNNSALAQAVSSGPLDKFDSTNAPILMYHHITINSDPNNNIEAGLDVSPDQFETQIQSLSNNNKISGIISNLFNSSPENSVFITFDDGYEDVFTNAFPIMQKFNMVGTVYIITDYVGNGRYLSWEQILQLKNAGWEVGSHTLSHPDLTKIPLEMATEQITISKTILESHLSVEITSFCYPAGKFNNDIANVVQNNGYSTAVTTKPGHKNLIDNLFSLKRIRVDGRDSIKQFNNKLYH